MNYNIICFVVMPFGIKKVDEKEVDFDSIYSNVFEPAISQVNLPEGGKLMPKRTDKDYYSGLIDSEMFKYLEYSRFVFADITSLNANVFYELGIRHRAAQNGTAIFRQPNTTLPFDINHIKAFPYEYEPDDKIIESRELIVKVLNESLINNKMDSPVQQALHHQQSFENIDEILREATNALRNEDILMAISKYDQALLIDKKNAKLYLEKGLLHRDNEDWQSAMESFQQAANLNQDYSEAWRELGIAQNKIYHAANAPEDLSTGLKSLEKALELDPENFDALSSLGGIMKREEEYEKAQELYKNAVKISNGHPYPLMNYLILLIKKDGLSAINSVHYKYLKRARIPLEKQVKDKPPYNAPWCFFDLATIMLFMKEKDRALTLFKEASSTKLRDYEVRTFLQTMKLIESTPIEGLLDVIKWAENELEALSFDDL